MENKKIPDDLVCVEITNEYSAQKYKTYMTHYVKMTLSHGNMAAFHFIETNEEMDNAYMTSRQVSSGGDLTIETLVKSVNKYRGEPGPNTYTWKIVKFVDLPENAKELFRCFESFANLNIDIVNWHTSNISYQ